MRSLLTLTLTLAALAAPAGMALAGTVAEDHGLHGNGEVSRQLWKPEFARLDIGGVRVGPSLALGLSGSIRDNLGRRYAPVVSVDLDRHTSVSLVHGGGRGAIVVFQFQN